MVAARDFEKVDGKAVRWASATVEQMVGMMAGMTAALTEYRMAEH